MFFFFITSLVKLMTLAQAYNFKPNTSPTLTLGLLDLGSLIWTRDCPCFHWLQSIYPHGWLLRQNAKCWQKKKDKMTKMNIDLKEIDKWILMNLWFPKKKEFWWILFYLFYMQNICHFYWRMFMLFYKYIFLFFSPSTLSNKRREVFFSFYFLSS